MFPKLQFELNSSKSVLWLRLCKPVLNQYRAIYQWNARNQLKNDENS